MDKGLIHIYTGNGKGKTTAAVGIAVRARSRGLRTVFAQFFKEKDPNNEIASLDALGVRTIVFDSVKSPLFNPDIDRPSLRAEARKSLSMLKTLFHEGGGFDLMVIDEFICLIAEGVISEEDALSFLGGKPEGLELVLTGKGAPDRIMECADYVTFMKDIKHPFSKKTEARRGIEF